MTEASNLRGTAVTKIPGSKYALPVTFETIGVAAPLATLDGLASNVVLTNGNLTATYVAGPPYNGARSATVKSSGKFYFEMTPAIMRNIDAIGILLSTGTYANLDTDGTNCTAVYGSGAIWSNNANTSKSITAWAGAPGPAIGVAFDMDARRAWFRRGSGNWNGDPTANPATGVGGVTIAASGSFGPAIGFGGSTGDSVSYANFGQSAFANAAPSGFDKLAV